MVLLLALISGLFLTIAGGGQRLMAQAPPAVAGSPFAMIRNVAVVPFQWQGVRPDSYRWQEVHQQLDQDFYGALKASERFNLINPGVSDPLWSSPRGRRTLVDRYELQGYFNLTATEKSGGVKMVARLLSPSLNNIFLESWTMDTRGFLALSPEQLRERITDLTFRLINRFPLDARVTSIQDQFVTLSGGRNLGIGSKEKFPIYRASVASIHPATGGPASFTRKRRGWVEIVDSRQFSSIARIIKQNHDGAIAVLDGIFIPTMTTRARFPDEAVVEESPPQVIPLPKEPVPAPVADTPPPLPPAPSAQPAPPPVAQGRPLQPVDIGIGVYNFSVSGAAKAESTLPSTLLNSIHVGTRMAIDSATQWELEAGYASGETKNGSYNMFDVQLAGTLHQSEPDGAGLFPNWYWGLVVGYRSKGLSGDEVYGGLDVFSVGGALGAYSNYRALSPEMVGRLSLDLRLAPLGFGQVGLAGEKAQIGGYLGLGGKLKFLMQPAGQSQDALWFGPQVDFLWQNVSGQSGGSDLSGMATRFSLLIVLAL